MSARTTNISSSGSTTVNNSNINTSNSSNSYSSSSGKGKYWTDNLEPCLRVDRILQSRMPLLWCCVKWIGGWIIGSWCFWFLLHTHQTSHASPPSSSSLDHSVGSEGMVHNGDHKQHNHGILSQLGHKFPFFSGHSSGRIVAGEEHGVTIVSELSTYNSSVRDLKTMSIEFAIQSWLTNAKFVLALVEDDKLCVSLVQQFSSPSLICVQHHCNHQDYNIPTVPCLMVTGEAYAPTKYVLFSNSDIIFGPIQPTLDQVTPQLESFVLTGQRTDVLSHKAEKLVFGEQEGVSGTSKHVRYKKVTAFDILEFAKREGENHGDSAIDYFLYPKTCSLARKMPPFLLGNWRWDNWLLHEFIVANHVKVIDSTGAITAVHIGSTATALVHRPGAVHNSRVFESSTFGLQGIGMGTFKYAEARMYKGKVVYNTDFEISQTKFIFSAAKSSETLIVVTVPCGFVGMLKNWLTWAERSHLHAFVIFAMDLETLQFAKQEKLPVVTLTSQTTPTTVQCQQLSKHDVESLLIDRNMFLKNVSSTGLGFVSMSVNSVVLEPIKYSYLRSRDLFGQKYFHPSGTPASVTKNSTMYISDLFWGTSSLFSKNSVKLLNKVLECQQAKINIARRSLALNDGSSEVKQCAVMQLESFSNQCLNEEIKKGGYHGGLSYLGEGFVASGTASFIQHNPVRLGLYPAIVHQDLFCSYPESTATLKKWNLWAEDESISSVLPHVKPLVPTVMSNVSSSSAELMSAPGVVALAIRILTMNRPEQLNALLYSLSNATYDSSDVVDIEIHIDFPYNVSMTALPETSDGQAVALYREIQKIANDFIWTHGEKRVVDPGKHRGLFYMWVQPFVPRVPGQVLMVLEDDNELSPAYYGWCETLLQHLSLHNDPKLYGLSLQRQHSVIALKPDQKYPMTFIDLKMDQSKPLYRYQLLSSWGTILFPTQWNNFVDWAVKVKTTMPDFHPCVPYFFNNIWYNKKPGHIWTIWFNYYIYMNGMYSLYINYARYDEDDGKYFSLLKNHRAQGLHFDGKNKKAVARKPDMQDMLQFLMEGPPKMLLPPTSYPLYDFHYQYVPNSEVLKDRWRFTSGIHGHDKCVANHDENGRPFNVKGKATGHGGGGGHPHGHGKKNHKKSMEQK